MTAIRQATLDDAEPIVVRRLMRPGDTVAHLFGPIGWTRSLCRGVMWTAALREPTDVATDCADCRMVVAALNAVTHPALTEGEARAMDGNR